MRTLAFRRHQENKKKDWAKKVVKENYLHDPTINVSVLVGIYAHSPTRCSCILCGNYRNHYGNSHAHKISELRQIPLNE